MTHPPVETTGRSPVAAAAGFLIINADDWGRDRDTTDRTLECVLRGAVSSVSAMVFMEDSERAAAIARERGIDAGLHLNLTVPFTAPAATANLTGHQERLSLFLRRNRYAWTIFHPGLVREFQYSVSAQLAEFARLYGSEPRRIDGHHHMHLCSNVVLGRLLPAGTVVRRNLSFEPDEIGLLNRLYRKVLDRKLERHHRLADFLFALPPLDPPARLRKIFSLARDFAVEVETHPVQPDEYEFLAGGEIFKRTKGDPRIASSYELPRAGRPEAETPGETGESP